MRSFVLDLGGGAPTQCLAVPLPGIPPSRWPPAGGGLNKAATCTLFGIWPKRKANGQRRPLDAFARDLQAVPNTEFRGYDPESGKWTFAVRGGHWY